VIELLHRGSAGSTESLQTLCMADGVCARTMSSYILDPCAYRIIDSSNSNTNDRLLESFVFRIDFILTHLEKLMTAL
jgi:hypothetical protein